MDSLFLSLNSELILNYGRGHLIGPSWISHPPTSSQHGQSQAPVPSTGDICIVDGLGVGRVGSFHGCQPVMGCELSDSQKDVCCTRLFPLPLHPCPIQS